MPPAQGRGERAGESQPASVPAVTAGIDLPPILGRRHGQLPSGRHRLPRELIVRSQRTRIVDAMARVMAEKGYADATVGEILEQAGVSRSTFYQHYRSKEDCFDRTFSEIAERFRSGLQTAIGGADPWPDRVARVLGTLVEAIRREPAIATLCLVEAHSATPHSRQLYERAMGHFEALLDESEPPSAAECPRELSRAVISGLAGLLHREISAGRVEDLPDLLPCMIYWVISPYEGRGLALEVSGAATLGG